MTPSLPVELWEEIINELDRDSRNRRGLLPLMLVCKLMYEISTPIVYKYIVIPANPPNDHQYELSWMPIHAKSLTSLHQTLTTSSKLVSHTRTLVSNNAYHQFKVMGWTGVEELLPFFTNLKQLSLAPYVCSWAATTATTVNAKYTYTCEY
ncbi:hypothetical protein ONZ45_g13291 [Pleurotus djamor]|nr:hypothetical protein ONZ45_g13291 [Pleurotus djamor]